MKEGEARGRSYIFKKREMPSREPLQVTPRRT
jgi:hypothetical protein